MTSFEEVRYLGGGLDRCREDRSGKALSMLIKILNQRLREGLGGTLGVLSGEWRSYSLKADTRAVDEQKIIPYGRGCTDCRQCVEKLPCFRQIFFVDCRKLVV